VSADSPDLPYIRTIFHPTDFSPESNQAFVHALAIAVLRRAELTILHAGREYLGEGEWTKFPQVRETLARWKLLDPDCPPAEVHRRLGVRVNKIDATGSPVEAAMEFLEDEPADLMVLGTQGREGLPRWFRPSTAEQMAEAAGIKTIFVRQGMRPFVSEDGDLRMRRALVPVAAVPDPGPTLVYATRAALLAAGEPLELVALHVGAAMPALSLPEAPGCSWRSLLRQGDVIEEIVRAAGEIDADCIFMATDGRNTLSEFARGSHTEQVVRAAPCPVAAIPLD
jgi:nucleotide-binding universal stress UspA family protein